MPKRRPPPARPPNPPRQEAEETTAIGIRAVAAVLQTRRARRLFVDAASRNARVLQLQEQATAAGVAVEALSARQLAQLTGSDKNQGVAARALLPQGGLELALQAAPRPLLAIDGVTDPRNLGALARVARAFDAAAIVAPKRRAAPLAAAARAAAGALAFVPVARVANMARALQSIKDAGWTVIGADETGDPAALLPPPPPPLCFVLGDEGGGLRQLTRRHCDLLARIPTVAGEGGCLNVAAAAAVCLFSTTLQTANCRGAGRQ